MRCQRCDGEGMVETGRLVGPCESEHVKRCPDCDGTGEESGPCQDCGERVAAVVVDGIRQCRECAEAMDETRAALAA